MFAKLVWSLAVVALLSHTATGDEIIATELVGSLGPHDDIADFLDFAGSHHDLGDIASDGSGGRQTLVRPCQSDDIGRSWKFFDPYFQLPHLFSEPPATPRQDEVVLTASTPLVLVLPQLQHFPMGANVWVGHSIDGNTINVDASIRMLGYTTATIYGPHEFLYSLGTLEAGEYRLILNVARTDWSTPDTPSTSQGYVDFVVFPVPEPSTMLSALCGLLVLACRRRWLSA